MGWKKRSGAVRLLWLDHQPPMVLCTIKRVSKIIRAVPLKLLQITLLFVNYISSEKEQRTNWPRNRGKVIIVGCATFCLAFGGSENCV